jgi:hypothetical protein
VSVCGCEATARPAVRALIRGSCQSTLNALEQPHVFQFRRRSFDETVRHP